MVTLIPHRGIARSLPADNRPVANSQVLVERGRFTDILAVARLQRRCFRRSLAYRPTTLFALYLWPKAAFLVARAGDKVVGSVIGDVHGGQSRVISICVDPEWRRRGIGHRLLAQIECELPTGNMILMVEAGNVPAEQLYRKRGYLAVGESRDYYGRGRNGTWMQKSRTATG
jgi:[ribosomal protein S18]-alanine N-acetyltransferase